MFEVFALALALALVLALALASRARARVVGGGGSSYVALQLGPVVPAMDTGKLSRNS